MIQTPFSFVFIDDLDTRLVLFLDDSDTVSFVFIDDLDSRPVFFLDDADIR